MDSGRQRVENVIVDNDQPSEEDDDDNFIVDEGAHDTNLALDRQETVAPPSEDDGEHGS